MAQVRATLRDRAGGATGTVTARVEVPDIDAPYLSTPFLTDRTQPPLVPGEPPRLVPTALRRFTQGRPLHCQYEVLAPGAYELLLGVEDRLARRAFSVREAFVVEAEAAGSP